MKLPRLTNPPMCYTFESWAYRMAVGQLFSYAMVAGIFIWLISFLKEQEENLENIQSLVTVLIVIIVLCFFPVIFAVVLLIALTKKSTLLLKIWIIYGVIASVVWSVVLIALAIYVFTLDTLYGVVLIFVGLALAINMFYSVLIINTIRANILENKESENTRRP